MVIKTRSSTQGKTEKTGKDISADTADKVCKDVNIQLVDGKAKTHHVLVDLDASNLPFASESLRSGGCCEGCIELRSEMKEMRQEIERLTAMSAYSNLPAETRSPKTSENMQIIERLREHNTSLHSVNSVCVRIQTLLQTSLLSLLRAERARILRVPSQARRTFPMRKTRRRNRRRNKRRKNKNSPAQAITQQL